MRKPSPRLNRQSSPLASPDREGRFCFTSSNPPRLLATIPSAALLAATLLAALLIFPTLPSARAEDFDAANQAKLTALLAKIRAAGYPTTAEEFERWYPEPKADNAQDLYFKANAAMSQAEGLYDGVPFLSNTPDPDRLPLTRETRQAIVNMLDANEKALSFLDDAANIKECRFPLDIDKGFNALLPHLGMLRKFARQLECRQLLEADRGNASAAMRTEVQIFHLANTMRDEPIVISQLVRNSIEAMALDRLQWTLAHTKPADTDLVNVAAELDRQITLGAPARVLAGERCMALVNFDLIYTLNGKPDNDIDPIPSKSQRLIDQIAYLEYVDRLIARANDPLKHLDPEVDKAAVEAMAKNNPQVSKAVSASMPGLSPFLKPLLWQRAALETARTAVAATRFHLATGRWPDKLEDLSPRYLPKPPIDPYTNAPLLLKQTDTQLLIYSVGLDGKDDGGQGSLTPSSKHPMSVPGTDVVFTLWKVPPPVTDSNK